MGMRMRPMFTNENRIKTFSKQIWNKQFFLLAQLNNGFLDKVCWEKIENPTATVPANPATATKPTILHRKESQSEKNTFPGFQTD